MRSISCTCIAMGLLTTTVLAGSGTVANVETSMSFPVRGIVRPVQQAAITTELQARVLDVKFKEGDVFSKGDVLVEFDCERQRAEFDAVAAQLRETKATFEIASYLDKKGASGRLEVDVARARMDKSEAEVAALTSKLKLCKVLAPFNGRLAERFVQAHEVPAVGKPLVTIVDDANIEIELIVPSTLLRRMTRDTRFSFMIDELGESYSAVLVRTGAIVDPVSQTLKVFATFVEKPAKVLPGMSGSAAISDFSQ